jgi:endonuclease YncB( thermonuclease family)
VAGALAAVLLGLLPARPAGAQPLWTTEPTRVIRRPAEPERERIEVDTGFEATFPKPLRIDADGFIETTGPRIRLARIVLPDRQVLCAGEAGFRWACGNRAYLRLNAVLGGRTAFCGSVKDADKAELATDCRLRGRSIAEWMVAEGWASPAEAGDDVLRRMLERAKTGGLGLWGNGAFTAGR